MRAKSENVPLAFFIVVLVLVLTPALYAMARLVSFHESAGQTVVYLDSPELMADAGKFRCTRMPAGDFDIRDYSYNVVRTPTPSRMYRYKTNLPAEPPVQIHLLAMEGGSGRVVVEKSDKPVWLVLLSARAGIWHVQQAPGADLQKVVTNQDVSEIRFSDVLPDRVTGILDYLLGNDAVPAQAPEILVMPNSSCLKKFTRFQSYDDQAGFLNALASIRAWLGHPEKSFQSAELPSYFGTAFRIPFTEVPIAPERLAAVKKLAEKPPSATGRRAAAVHRREALTAALQQYADMPRRNDVKSITFSSPADFVGTLGEYRNRKLLPSSMPISRPGSRSGGVASWYALADYRNAYSTRVPSGRTEDACGRDQRLLIIEGTPETNIVKCAWGSQLYFMGGGDDDVQDSWGDDVIYGGPGDDIIDAGWGNDLLFFNYGWGQDTVTKTCHDSSYIPQDSVGSTKVHWDRTWPYKNFIVFGKDVRSDDIVSVNDKLVHKETGDSITIDGNCFNVVYWP